MRWRFTLSASTEAVFNIEHEHSGTEQDPEFQLVWKAEGKQAGLPAVSCVDASGRAGNRHRRRPGRTPRRMGRVRVSDPGSPKR